MSIGIIGSKGNMGRRYMAICRYLDIPTVGFDIDDFSEAWDHADKIRSLIIATPTHTHLHMIRLFSEMGKPMLVEKPVVTSADDLNALMAIAPKVRMVNQYQYLCDHSKEGESYYDYWNSGKDGVWDFINIIGLSERRPIIRNISPIWKCAINGHTLNIRDMDHAYCDMIWNWHKNPTPNLNYIESSHRRVLEGFYVG